MHKAVLFTVFAAGMLAPQAVQAQAAPLAPIEQASLARDAFSTGLLDRNAGALGADLWRGADASALAMLLEMAPLRPSSPSVGAALRRVLLSPGDAPPGATAALGGAKLKALARAGFIDESRQIESLAANTSADLASAEAMVVADILSGDVKAGCDKGRRVTAGLENSFWVRLRIVCYAASNELDAAELALGIMRESSRLSEVDETLLAPLASGGKVKTPVAPSDAVQYAAMKLMGTPIAVENLAQAEAGVVKAIANDQSRDWAIRLVAAARAASMGVMSGAELQSLHAESPISAAPAFHAIRAMADPERLRDRAGMIAEHILAAGDFSSLFVASVLYTDEIREIEGAVLPASDAGALALARMAVGDAVGAERWLNSAAPEFARGLPDDQSMRYIDLVGVFSILDRAGAERVAGAANIAVAPPRFQTAAHGAPSDRLAPVVAAAIEAARLGATGESALAALAASEPAANGDLVAEAIVSSSLRAAGLFDIARRREVEAAIAGLYPAGDLASKEVVATPASAPAKLTPRLKPKRST